MIAAAVILLLLLMPILLLGSDLRMPAAVDVAWSVVAVWAALDGFRLALELRLADHAGIVHGVIAILALVNVCAAVLNIQTLLAPRM